MLALVAGASAHHGQLHARPHHLLLQRQHQGDADLHYMKNGKRIPEAMEKINWILRDWRKDEPTKMDPDLIDLVWEVHSELGSAEPIHVISGFRSRGTNDMLRRTVGGQASQSRHILGKAMDVHFPDVPVKKLRYSALIRERGGVGYYPTSAIPFVHIDTDRVRAWPRLPRAGACPAVPQRPHPARAADGGPITPEDVRRARAANKELAAQIAEFHELRTRPKPAGPGRLADALPAAAPGAAAARATAGGSGHTADRWRARAGSRRSSAEPLPQLVVGPTPVSRQRVRRRRAGVGRDARCRRRSGCRPARSPEAGRLAQPRHSFVPAPAYDEEHPEELSYRPFPIAPFLTATASVDDPALARIVHPDLAKMLEMLDQAGSVPPMRLRPGSQTAQLLWAQQFKGEAINLSSLIDLGRVDAPPKRAGRSVVTQAQ